MFVDGVETRDQEGFFLALAKSGRADSYCNSLAYYMLTARYGARIYTDGSAYLVVAAHPHVEDRLMVFPEVNGTGALTCRVLADMEMPRCGVQLARYTQDDLDALHKASAGVASHKHIELLETNEPIMDWEFPVHILDVEATAAMSGKKFHAVRNNFNRAQDRLSVVPLDAPEALRGMRAAVLIWLASRVYADQESGHSLTAFYDTLIAMIEKKPDMFGGFVTMDGKEPAGFTIWDRPQNGTANAIAGLSRRNINGMSEYQNVMACRMLKEQGVKNYNLGGSETVGLDHHKRLYNPKASFTVKSYEVKIHNRLMAGVKTLGLPDWGAPSLRNRF